MDFGELLGPWIAGLFSGFSWTHTLAGTLIFLAVWAGLSLAYRFGKNWLPSLAPRLGPNLEPLSRSLMAAARPRLIPIIAFCAGISTIGLGPQAQRAVSFVFAVLVTYQLMLFVNSILDFLFIHFDKRKVTSHAKGSTKSNVIAGVKFCAWLLALLVLLDNFGVNVSTFVAGLGIGGIAVALAAQAVLGDTFGSFTITLDKPFLAGDYIAFGGDEGRVETVGLKTTRIRGQGGEAIIVPNSELTRFRLKNYADLEERRGVLKQTIANTTPLDVTQALTAHIGAAISAISDVRVNRVHMIDAGSSGFVFEIEWFSKGAAQKDFLDRQQQILFALLTLFAEQQISRPGPNEVLLTSYNEIDRLSAALPMSMSLNRNALSTHAKKIEPQSRARTS